MDKAKVSAIISFYNSEQYAEKCLRSVMDQTLKELEIIVIDDGSTDRTRRIVEETAKDDPRVVYVAKVNGGLASSRKQGMALIFPNFSKGFCQSSGCLQEIVRQANDSAKSEHGFASIAQAKERCLNPSG